MPDLLKITSARGDTIPARSGDLYRQGVHKLVNKFKAWLVANALLDETAILALKKFLTNFEYSGTSEHYSKTTYPFFTEGVITLAKIMEKIQNEEIPLFFRKDTIKNLIPGLTVCAPGIHTNLINADLKLSRDLPVELMGIRRNIAEQVALAIIRKHMPNFGNSDLHQHQPNQWEIAEGYEMHYSNAILNLYSNLLGIPAIPDENAPQALPDGFEDEFASEIKSALRTSAIIEAIMLSTDCWQIFLLKKPCDVKPDDVDIINNWLNHYGDDNTFNFKNLFEYDEASEEIRWCSNSMEYYFHQSLVRRLAQRGYFDLATLQTKSLPENDTKFYIPQSGNIMLATAKESASDEKPFISYYIDQFCEGKNIDLLHSLLSKDQLSELRALAIPQLEIVARRIMRDSNLKAKDNFLNAFNETFPRNYLILIDILSAADTNTKLRLAQRYQLTEHIRVDNSFVGLIKYISLFPQERWQQLITSFEIWGNSLIAQREDLQTLIRLLQKNNSLNLELLQLIATFPDKCKELIQAIEEINQLEPSIINITTLRLLVKSSTDPIIVADSLNKLHALNPKFINRNTCHILQNYTGDLRALIKGLQNLNLISPSLLSDKFFRYVATAPSLRIDILLFCIETLYKVNTLLLSDENLVFLFDKGNRSGLFAHILATWFKINPALIHEAHRNILIEACPNITMAKHVSKLFEDLLQTYPSLVTNNNLKRIILGTEEINSTLLDLKKVNPTLITDTILVELIADSANAKNVLTNTLNKYISARLEAAFPTISIEIHKELQTKFLLNEKVDVATVIDRLYRVSPSLITQENMELLLEHGITSHNYNLADLLDKLFKIKASLVSSLTFKTLVTANSPQLKQAISGMGSALNDEKNYQLLFDYPNTNEILRLSRAMTILADTNPVLLNDEMRSFLVKYATSAIEFALGVVTLFNTSPSLVNSKNLNILGEASNHRPILARALITFYKDNYNILDDTQIALIQKNAANISAGLNHLAMVDRLFDNEDSIKFLVYSGEHAATAGKKLSKIYSKNFEHSVHIASAMKIIFKEIPEILTADNLTELETNPTRLHNFCRNVIKLHKNNSATAPNINLLFQHPGNDGLIQTLITLEKLSLINEVNITTLIKLKINVYSDEFRKLLSDHPQCARPISNTLETHPRHEFVNNRFYVRLNKFINTHATLFNNNSEEFTNCMLQLFAFSDQKNIGENPLTYFSEKPERPIAGKPQFPYEFFGRESLPPTKTKICAAENMIQYLSGDSPVTFSPLQLQGLKNGKLGKILSTYRNIVNVDQLPHYPSLS